MKFEQINKNFEHIVPPATSAVNGMVNIPLVFSKEKDGIHGFVPGFAFKDAISNNIDDCHKLLKLLVKDEVLKRIENQKPFPFFPSDEEIYKDFDNVIKIERINFELPTL